MTRAWFLWFMMSPGPIDGVVAPLFTTAPLFILWNKWLQFNHQSKLLKHLGGNCDVTVVVSMATAIPSGTWYRGNQEHPEGQEWAPASERGIWGASPDTPLGGKKSVNCYWISHLENWDVDLDFASLDKLVVLISCREIFRKILQLLCRDEKQNYLSCTVWFC